MSTNRTAACVHVGATEPVAGPEGRDGRDHGVLKLAAALRVARIVRQAPQEFAHQGADRSVLLGGLDSRTTVDVIRK